MDRLPGEVLLFLALFSPLDARPVYWELSSSSVSGTFPALYLRRDFLGQGHKTFFFFLFRFLCLRNAKEAKIFSLDKENCLL